MVVGILQIEIRIDWSQSLKDKRRVVSSLKDKLHRGHQVSVAEVDSMDDLQVAILGITLASNSKVHSQGVFQQILESLRQARDCVLSDYTMEFLTGGQQ